MRREIRVNLFEQLIDSVYRRHDQSQADHERIMKEQQRELDQLDQSAERFGHQVEQFAETSEAWLGEDAGLPGVFK
nr:hypothetical protein [Bacillus sonorensis]